MIRQRKMVKDNAGDLSKAKIKEKVRKSLQFNEMRLFGSKMLFKC